MPTVVVPHILVDDDDPKRSIDTICRVLSLAAVIVGNGLMDWSFPTEAIPVEVTTYQLEERPAGYLAAFVKASTRH